MSDAEQNRPEKSSASVQERIVKVAARAGGDSAMGRAVREAAHGVDRKVAIVGALALLLALAWHWRDTVFIAGTDFNRFNVTVETAFDPSDQKFQAANWGLNVATRAAALDHREGERVLVFRQSSFGYLENIDYLYFLDDEMAPFYYIEDPEELAAALRSAGVRQIIQPDYSLAQIENSAFSSLFGDPRLAEVTYSFANWRVYQLLNTPPSLEPVQIAGERFSEDPDALAQWVNGRIPLPLADSLTTPPPMITRDREEGFIELRRERRFYGRQRLSENLQRGELLLSQPASLTQTYDFGQFGELARVSAVVEGDGLFELVVVATYGRGDQAHVVETKVWTGVLFEGEKRLISAQYIDDSFMAPMIGQGEVESFYRVGFRIRDPGYLRLYEWSVEAFPGYEPMAAQRMKRFIEPLENGWFYQTNDTTVRPLEFGRAETDPEPGDLLTPARMRRFDSRAVDMLSPIFVAPLDFYEIDALDTGNQIAQAYRPSLRAEMSLTGHGYVEVFADVVCFGSRLQTRETSPRTAARYQARNEPWQRSALDVHGNTMMRADVEVFPQGVLVPIGRYLLNGDGPRRVESIVEPPCLPTAVRLQFLSRRHTLFVAPDLALSDISVGDIDLTLERFDRSRGLESVAMNNLVREEAASGSGEEQESLELQ